MARDIRQIRIESILGGHAPITGFAGEGQFLSSLGIDPSSPSSGSTGAYRSSGFLVQNLSSEITSSLASPPMWFLTSMKNGGEIFVYNYRGSVYTLNNADTLTALSDAGAMSNSSGNGGAYYDNYMYFAKNTTIVRYGPLDGTPTFDEDYWSTTLSKTPLTDTQYPTTGEFDIELPNHVMLRHSDGRLYIADVVGNQGTLHYIQTTKTTTEGDTDNGSKYDAVDFGFGLHPTAIESYGEYVVVALFEASKVGQSAPLQGGRVAKLAFWDTTSERPNFVIFREFPDAIITALKNVNGTLYITSGNGSVGFRLSKYVGGNVIEEVAYFEYGNSPLAGAIDGTANRLVFGTRTVDPENAATVYSYGLQNSAFGNGLFNIFGKASTLGQVTALTLTHNNGGLYTNGPTLGWSESTSSGKITRVGGFSGAGTSGESVFWSAIYRIGSPFKITKIRIPLTATLGTGQSVVPTLYFDNGNSSKTLTTISSANFGDDRISIVIRPVNATGDSNFWLGFRWTGTSQCTIALPITIEYELLDVDSTLE